MTTFLLPTNGIGAYTSRSYFRSLNVLRIIRVVGSAGVVSGVFEFLQFSILFRPRLLARLFALLFCERLGVIGRLSERCERQHGCRHGHRDQDCGSPQN